jgi:hypothetical protein
LKTAKLWPSLASIRSEFYPEPLNSKVLPGPSNAGYARPSKASVREIMGPLQDLARRRAAVAERKFSKEWAPSRLVPIKVLASVRAVLLDQCVGPDHWRAFMVAPECDWAGYSDVLLEPSDEPFDPMCGMVQTWNSVIVKRQQRASDDVLGELSTARMSAVREAVLEYSSQPNTNAESQPGFIALRILRSGSTILTGSPLGETEASDPRISYKTLYQKITQTISL